MYEQHATNEIRTSSIRKMPETIEKTKFPERQKKTLLKTVLIFNK